MHSSAPCWPTSTPDGNTLAFQAVGHIWVQDAEGGAARRLTPKTFDQLEYAPAWSPNGRELAFVTYEDTARGHVWKVAATGGTPTRLTKEPGDYVDPVWSADGKSVIVARGEGATARQRTLTHNAWFDLVRLSTACNDTGVALAMITRPTGSSIRRARHAGTLGYSPTRRETQRSGWTGCPCARRCARGRCRAKT
jgi:dipeptidyl aminopeptidase/acylaminoacyl peptidase